MDRVEYQKYAPKGMVNRGNRQRIRNCMKKAMAGQPLTIGFLGGSITQGSLASSPKKCYAFLVYEWWKQKFPMSEIAYINAGVGGTTSQFGVARVKDDLLAKKPDFAVIEFSVNDDANDLFEETYEGLIRTIEKSDCRPAVLLLHNVRYDSGASAEEYHRRIGEAYHLPCVSMKTSLYPNVVSGRIKKNDISPDGLHPNDLGHRFVADTVIACLEDIFQDLATVESQDPLPKPLTRNRYEDSRRLQNDNCRPACSGFTEDLRPQERVSDAFKRGWVASKTGAAITFEFMGTSAAVQYRKSVKHPAPIAEAIIDGDESHAVKLDANFEEEWGDCLAVTMAAQNLPMGKHKLEIRITQAEPNLAAAFYLVSIIVSR